MRLRILGCVCVLILGLALGSADPVQAQVNTANLSGTVLDPSGAAVPGAKVTLKNLATGAARTHETDSAGQYQLIGLPPGRYEVTVEAKGFTKMVNPELVLTVGQAAEFNPQFKQVQAGGDTITVESGAEIIETTKTAVTETVDSRRINNLPINGRNYINFTLTTSQATRDNAPSIGAAPTSGISFGGGRARSNQVSVDGADATDNSINGVRATVSQEAVQEFQVIVSNYNAEFGRATGGVINIVTKNGTNEVHGNAFGFLRHKSIQARNPFSVDVDPTTGLLRPVKQGYTRVQAGATIGGPIIKDKTFYFLSYEITRRQETGFTNIGANNFGMALTPVPALLQPVVGVASAFMTPAQAAFVSDANGGAATVALRAPYFGLVRAASAVALNGRNIPGAVFASSGAPLPLSYVGLNSLRGNYPAHEGTSIWSARLDHRWNEKDNSFVRANVTPSLVTGIQVNAQNQNFGQNAFSRTSLQQTRDLAIVGQHTRLWGDHHITEARFQFARRGLHYGFADTPEGAQVAVDILGFGHFGREPFSTVDRIERRWQWTANHTWVWNKHTFKFGGDVNWIQLRSKKVQIFELNFGGLYRFAPLPASTFGFTNLPSPLLSPPAMTRLQTYGLGLPQVFIQGIGESDRPFDNKAFGFYAQDSWKLTRRLTLNAGVRYDYEITPLFSPATALNAAAEAAFNLVEGIPRDKNNWSPRIALAWDPTGNAKTVIRLGYGLFYDHPLLAIAFNASTAEGALSSQLIMGGGTPSAAAVTPLNAASVVNAGSIFQGILGGVPVGTTCGAGIPASYGYLCQQQRFDPHLPNSMFVNHNFITQNFPLPGLPFTLHIADNFEYGYAGQSNLTIEHRIGADYKVSASYTYTHGVHLNRPHNITPTDPARLMRNFTNARVLTTTGGYVLPTNPLTLAAPVGASQPGSATACGYNILAQGALSQLTGCPAALTTLNNQFVGTPAFFNFFRATGPNPSFQGLAGGYANQVALATLAGFPQGPGVQVPWSDVMQQESSGNSNYHGLTMNFSKHGKYFEFLTSWTWSHAIDDSTDLQTLLAPQDNRRPDLERGNSTFDQRHRWVSSMVFISPWKTSDDMWVKKILANFTVSPIVEVSTGRPFTVLTGNDNNMDFASATDRPSAALTGGVSSSFLRNSPSFIIANVCPNDPLTGGPIAAGTGCTGNVGRNTFYRPNFYNWDLRVSRRFQITERWSLDFITDMFNLFNRYNVNDVNPLCDPTDPSACRVGQATATYDPRQLQFALKVNW